MGLGGDGGVLGQMQDRIDLIVRVYIFSFWLWDVSRILILSGVNSCEPVPVRGCSYSTLKTIPSSPHNPCAPGVRFWVWAITKQSSFLYSTYNTGSVHLYTTNNSARCLLLTKPLMMHLPTTQTQFLRWHSDFCLCVCQFTIGIQQLNKVQK